MIYTTIQFQNNDKASGTELLTDNFLRQTQAKKLVLKNSTDVTLRVSFPTGHNAVYWNSFQHVKHALVMYGTCRK